MSRDSMRDAAPAPVSQGDDDAIEDLIREHGGRSVHVGHGVNEWRGDDVDPAPVAQVSDKHLTLIASRWGLHALTGKDRDDLLAFGRACMEAACSNIARSGGTWAGPSSTACDDQLRAEGGA